MKRIAVLAVAVVVVALAAPSRVSVPMPALAQAPPRDQMDPDITFLAAREEFLVVWSEDRGAGPRIYAKRVRANGLPVGGATGGEWEASPTAPILGPTAVPGPAPPRGAQRWPAVIDGLLFYSERPAGGADYDLYAVRLFDNGRATGAPLRIAGGPGDQQYADVVAVSRGRTGEEYLVVWSENTRDAGDVMGLRIDYALRRSRGPAFAIAQAPGTAEDPVVTRDPVDERSFLVLFTDDRAGNRDIYATRLVESGLPRGGPTGGQYAVIDSPEDESAPAIVNGLDLEGFGPTPTPGRQPPGDRARSLLLWTEADVATGPNVRARRLNSNGLPQGNAFDVAAGPGVQAWPAVTLRRLEPTRPGERRERDEWLVVWAADVRGTLDLESAPVGLNGLARQVGHLLVAD